MAPSNQASRLPCIGVCRTRWVETPIGILKVIGCSRGLHSISQDEITDSRNPDSSILVAIVGGELSDKLDLPKAIRDCVDWLQTYFEHPKKISQALLPELCPNSCSTYGPFTKKVWMTLQSKVTFGRTISYAELGDLSGNSRAARAVGNAMGRNPFPLVVPCHRVVKSGGQTGAYCRGKRDHVKKWLLAYEKKASGPA
ncbi:methylated-DNA--protein-cysteine methyltransferase-like [Varroa destructor]|uniref:Methylated-DNA--protein-cysteine methyltransferase n=1 Tax=Varroa destructor TaxID=109461 RepID=A0A7M7J7A7_VARDE|nr:methylated-DNA--protein-cysteine methyltransferase-like [Varroa destructor]XP_022644095.1 methylated-DNA--protein-cysteine methyltransferase-like [Varroa destructor]XP_022644096.1 methylated-DNA--protein-cysteine methyltransferase-like [Varroa destructor]XP_022644097.1 methylated-DNA--protein-cysteine methyltransferase-like [Varroa destructor]XP_022644098.1 methylated-DNA--protein-cysteine methyltransferase-like [Varroa destructor]XP_022644099.1 methylated-DNA--protein-cysteine methyltransf